MTVPPFDLDYRASGVLLHVTSLPSPHGIGDLGPTAFAWIDRLHDAGQSWWQALPLGPTGYENSPYQALSSFAGNILLLSPDALRDDRLLPADSCHCHTYPERVVDYDLIIACRRQLIQQSGSTSGAPRAASCGSPSTSFANRRHTGWRTTHCFRP